jgi:acyl-CoA thioesterase-2
MGSPWAGGARALTRGTFHTIGGRHIASVAQEGLIRPVAPRQT